MKDTRNISELLLLFGLLKDSLNYSYSNGSREKFRQVLNLPEPVKSDISVQCSTD